MKLINNKLTDDLNRVVQAGPLYDRQRFAHVRLTEKTIRLVLKGQQGGALVRLNRTLLEEAYPGEIGSRRERSAGAPGQPKVRQEREGSPALQSLRTEIVTLSPNGFHRVRLELKDSSFVQSDADWGEGLDAASVRAIEISVRAREWDSMSSSQKVETLYRAFDLLKQQYPRLTPYIRLRFDDKREDLMLNFSDCVSGRFSLTGQDA